MVQKEEQGRLKALIKETITLMCKNGLKYQSGFCIEATIGITVDEDDILLVSMNETIKSELTDSLDKASEGMPGAPTSPSSRPARRRKKRRKVSGRTSPSPNSDIKRDSSDADYSPVEGDSIDSMPSSPPSRTDRCNNAEKGQEGGPSPSKKPLKQNGEGSEEENDIVCVEIKAEPGGRGARPDNKQAPSHRFSQPPSTFSQPAVFPSPSFPPSGLSFASDLSHMTASVSGGGYLGPPAGGEPLHLEGKLPAVVSQDGGALMPWSQGLPLPSTPGAPLQTSGTGFQLANMTASDLQGLTPSTSAQAEDGQLSSKNVCPQCDRIFPSPYNMQRHLNIVHKGIYDFSCPLCSKGFASSMHLRGHMASHTNVKEYRCQFCGKEFIYKHHMKKHMTVKHGNLVPLTQE